MVVLQAAAKKFQNPRLAALASQVRLDAFTKLKKQKADEIKHKDWCVEELNTNERTIENQSRDRDDLNAKIEDLTVQTKRAGEDRQKEHAEFMTAVADQRATQ